MPRPLNTPLSILTTLCLRKKKMETSIWSVYVGLHISKRMWSVILTVLSKLNDISTSQAVIYTVKGNISQNGARDM